MLVQISSGNGVDEVCRAIYYFLTWLEGRYSFEVLKIEYAKCKDCYKSVLLKSSDEALLKLEGTHLWRCQSPFRVKHKRKNWYFSLAIIKEQDFISFDESKVIYQTMKSPKKGGQHVNTTCSGVRAIYKPLNTEAVSYDERSQHLNKKRALERLRNRVEELEVANASKQKSKQWQEGKELERGNCILIFESERYILSKNSRILLF